MKKPKKLLNLIIECLNEESTVLFEQEPTDLSAGDNTDAGGGELDSLDTIASDEGDTGDQEATGGADEGNLGDIGAGGDEGGDETGGKDTDEEGAEDLDLGAGGGGGGGFDLGGAGGGGAGGAEEKPSGGKEKPEKETEKPKKKPEEIASPEDPVQATVDIAINMLGDTEDDQAILNAVKGSIQRNFENIDDATPIIQYLWDSNNPILKIVARKLLLFTLGR